MGMDRGMGNGDGLVHYFDYISALWNSTTEALAALYARKTVILHCKQGKNYMNSLKYWEFPLSDYLLGNYR